MQQRSVWIHAPGAPPIAGDNPFPSSMAGTPPPPPPGFGTPNYGIIASAGPARVGQMSLKLVF